MKFKLLEKKEDDDPRILKLFLKEVSGKIVLMGRDNFLEDWMLLSFSEDGIERYEDIDSDDTGLEVDDKGRIIIK